MRRTDKAEGMLRTDKAEGICQDAQACVDAERLADKYRVLFFLCEPSRGDGHRVWARLRSADTASAARGASQIRAVGVR